MYSGSVSQGERGKEGRYARLEVDEMISFEWVVSVLRGERTHRFQ